MPCVGGDTTAAMLRSIELILPTSPWKPRGNNAGGDGIHVTTALLRRRDRFGHRLVPRHAVEP